MMDPRKIGQFLLGEWDKTRQPLNERMSVLPFGQYEDGSVGLAWPGMVAAPVEGMQNFGRYGYDTPEAIRDNAASAFDVAGGAVTGGLSVGLAGGLADNAVGSAGGKLARGASDLPMDLASRMARAKEMGFDTETPLYHGTRREFDEFMPPQKYSQYGPGVYTARDPEEASRYAMLGENPDDARVLPLYAKAGQYATGDQVDRLAGELAQAGKATRRADAYELAVRQLMDEGYLGVDTAGGYRSVFDRSNIRSVNAAFDPSRSDSANLLAANAPTGAAVPLAMEGQEQDQNPAFLDYLRAIGLY